MNDFKFSSITPKRVIVGVVMVIAFLIIYSFIRSSLMVSSLGLSGSVASLGAPQSAMYNGAMPLMDGASGGMAMRQVAMDKSMAMEATNYGAVSDMAPLPESPSAVPPAGVSKIVKTGNLTLLVSNVEEAAAQITAIRTQTGGQPGNATFNEYRPGVKSGDITIWVPSDRFDEAMAATKKLALRVENESVRADDVSAQFVDLTARLKNLRAAEAQYVEIMKRSGKISDVLDVMRELNNTRSQIEQLQGQLDYLSHQVALSSIHVNLTQEAVPSTVTNEWRPLTVIKAAMKSSLNDLTNFVDMLLVFLIKLPILLLNIGFWIFIFWALWKVSQYAYRRLKGPGTTV